MCVCVCVCVCVRVRVRVRVCVQGQGTQRRSRGASGTKIEHTRRRPAAHVKLTAVLEKDMRASNPFNSTEGVVASWFSARLA